MTAPQSPSRQLATDDVKTIVDALIQNAHRLGLKWLLRPGEVVNGSDPGNVQALVDGDEVATFGIVSTVGRLIRGARVFLLIIPEVGTYVIGRIGSQVRTLVQSAYMPADASLTLGAAVTLVPGTDVSIDIGEFDYEVNGVFDFDETVAGTTVCIGELMIDGATPHAELATFEVTTVNHRATVSQQWAGTVTGGSSHTFGLGARRTAAAGTQVANLAHTTMLLHVYY